MMASPKLLPVRAGLRSEGTTNKRLEKHPKSAHTAAVRKKIQMYLLLYHQTTEQLLPPGCERFKLILLLSTAPSYEPGIS